jgi:hypothetical protein
MLIISDRSGPGSITLAVGNKKSTEEKREKLGAKWTIVVRRKQKLMPHKTILVRGCFCVVY